MSRSGLGWRNASAVAAASRNKADWLGRSSSDGGCPSAFSHRPVGGGRSRSRLVGLPAIQAYSAASQPSDRPYSQEASKPFWPLLMEVVVSAAVVGSLI